MSESEQAYPDSQEPELVYTQAEYDAIAAQLAEANTALAEETA